MFEPTLIGVASLMLEQIDGVRRKGVDVDVRPGESRNSNIMLTKRIESNLNRWLR